MIITKLVINLRNMHGSLEMRNRGQISRFKRSFFYPLVEKFGVKSHKKNKTNQGGELLPLYPGNENAPDPHFVMKFH